MKTAVLLLLVFLGFSAFGQDRLGMVSSNYNPSQSLYLNPSSILDSKVFFDIHLVGAQVFAHNNMAFLSGDEFRFFREIRNPENFPEPQYNFGRAPYTGHVRGNVFGPSATYSLGKQAFGIFTGVRVVADARRVPRNLGVYMVNTFQFADQMGQEFKVRNINVGALGYGEIGLSYARVIRNLRNDFMTAGISLKRLIGVQGVGVNLQKWDYQVVDSLNLNTTELLGTYAIATGGFNSGGGWGADLGFTYKKMLNDVSNYEPHNPRQNCRYVDYRWKLGVSLIDIGQITFKESAFAGKVRNSGDTLVWENYAGANPEGADEIADLIEEEFTSDGPTGKESEKVRFKLATALSIQYDYNFGKGFYVNSVLTYGFPRKKKLGVQHLHQFAAIPRWENKWFDAGIPVVLHDWRTFDVGAYFRFYCLIIGSDNLKFLIPGTDVYGADIYFNLKVPIFKHWGCMGGQGGGKSSGNSRYRGRGAKPCPTW